MNREEFMKELEYLLQDIPEDEKADALSYYRDYLDEAGDDVEQAIREFGSPERVAAIIRSDIAGHLEGGGEFTERGYEDERFKDPNYQVAKRYDLPEQKEQTNRGQQRTKENPGSSGNSTVLKVVLGILLILIGFPMILGLGGGVIGLLCGLFGILVGCIVVAGVIPLALFIATVVMGIMGIVMLTVEPMSGLLLIGIGFLLMGFGLLALLAAVQFYGRFLPWLFRGIIDFLNGLLRRRERRE